jgi:chromosome segregation ATPase
VCAASAVSIGCSKPVTCTVSPVEIEELREDVAVVQKNLATARERRDNLNKELAVKEADLDSKKDKPAELRTRLEELRRGSGRVEKPKATEPKTPQKPPLAPPPSGGEKKEQS